MIDFVKIIITNPEMMHNAWSSEHLTYYSDKEQLQPTTGEVYHIQKRKLKNLIVTRFQSKIEITGSLHYYYNNGLHNANDFNIYECIKTVEELENKLCLDLAQCSVINMEFGINIELPFSVKNVVTWLKYHCRNEFLNSNELKYSKFSAKFYKSDKINTYKIIKAYAKGLQLFDDKQTHAPENTFRFEVKSCQTKYINSVGIKSLSDLKIVSNYIRLQNELIKEWNDVLLLDRQTDFDNDKRATKYINSDFWENALNRQRNNFTYHRREYFNLLSEHPSNIFNTIRCLIVSKISAISTPPKQMGISAVSTINIIGNCTKTGQIGHHKEGEPINTNINPSKPRYCQVTGIDISMQRDDSFLLSHTGLKFIYKYNPELFSIIKNRFLSDFWSTAKTSIQIKEIAHNIRNQYFNMMNRQQKLYSENQPTLFNLQNMIEKKYYFIKIKPQSEN